MESDTTFNKQDAFKVILAVMTFGFGWVANNEATVIAFLAMVIVWAIRLIAKKYKYVPTKAALTITLFFVALGLSLIVTPVMLPFFPAWTGDPSTYALLLITYFSVFLKIAGGVVAYATGVYNILLAQVFDKIPEVAGQAVRRMQE